MLKNYEMSMKEKNSTPGEAANATTKAPAEAFAEMLKNPQAVLQKLVQGMNMMA